MRKSSAFALIALLGAAAAWVVLHDGPGDSRDGAEPRPPALTRRAPESASGAPASGFGAARGVALPAADRSAAVLPLVASAADLASQGAAVTLPGAVAARYRGRIVDLSGRPLAGARIVCLPASATRAASEAAAVRWSNFEPPPAFGHALSDGDGRFVLDDQHVPATPRSASDQDWHGCPDPQIAVRLMGYATRTQRCSGFRGGECDVGTLVLEPELVVSGRTVDVQQRPVAGVPVRVQSWSARRAAQQDEGFGFVDSFTGPLAGTGALSGPDGRFEIHGAWPGRSYVSFGDFRDSITNPESEAGRLELGDVVVAEPPGFRGVVVDGDGRPVGGAEVIALENQRFPFPPGLVRGIDDALSLLRSTGKGATTGADGRFTLHADRDAVYQLHARSPAHAPTRLTDVHPFGDELRIALRTLGTWTLHVANAQPATTVRALGHAPQPDVGTPLMRVNPAGATPEADADAEAVRDAGVALVVSGPLSAAPGDAPRTWTIAAASPVRTCVLVQAAGHASELRALRGVAPGQALELEIALVAECRATGSVRSTSGAPLPGALVKVAPADEHLARHFRWSVTADAEGHFDVAGLGPGRWTLAASAVGHAAGTPRDVTFDAAGQSLALDLELTLAASVHGRVLRADGSAVPAEPVLLSRITAAAPAGEPLLHVPADAAGDFTFDGLLPGSYALAADPGAETRVELIAGTPAQVELRLRAPPVVRGRILGGGEPVAGAEIFVFGTNGGGNDYGASDKDGRYQVTLLEPGDWDISVRPTAGRDADWGEFMLHAEWDQVVDFDVELGAGRIAGIVVDRASGAPLAGLHVSTEAPPGNFGGKSLAQVTDEHGRFLFRPLRDGSYVVSASGGVYREARSAPVELRRGGAAELRLELDAGFAALRVLVTDTAGRAPRAQRYSVSAAPAAQAASVPADTGAASGVLAGTHPDGLFVFEGLQPGEWTITLSDTGARGADHSDDRELQQQTVVLAVGEVRALQLTAGAP